MSKSVNNKKTKVPKLTEAEYTAYINSLKAGEEEPLADSMPASATAKALPPTPKKV